MNESAPQSVWKTIFDKLRNLWEWFKDLGATLKPCRFSLLMIVAGLAFLLLAPQGQDVLRGLAEWNDRFVSEAFSLVLFSVATLIWALNAWYWARVMLAFDFDSPEGLAPHRQQRRRRMCKQVPRILGVFAFATVAAAFFQASLAYAETDAKYVMYRLIVLALVWLALAVVFYVFTAVRRQISRKIHSQFAGKAFLQGERMRRIMDGFMLEEAEAACAKRYRTLKDIQPITWLALGLSMLLSFVLFLVFFIWPVSAAAFGAATIILLAAGTWIPFGSIVVYAGSRYRFPVITLALVGLVVFSFWNDNHAIRTLDDNASGEHINPNLPLPEHFKAWLKKGLADWPQDKAYPVFLVAAEGGGIRAAYWTALVLGALQDRDARFADHLYAVSGVSGGSLGAAVFDALLQEHRKSQAIDCGWENNNDEAVDENTAAKLSPYVGCASAVLSSDFLSPTVAYMLYPDLLQRFLPFAVPPFDRARALEVAWEAGWSEQFESRRFAKSFHDLWANKESRIPALFLNSTHVESGKRVIVSNLKIEEGIFSDAKDFFDLIQSEVRLSSATHNSARFTYVSPAGTVVPPEGEAWGHLVDGGYFENSGASTLYEILNAMQTSADANDWKRIVPVVIMITNDPKQNDQAVPSPRQFMNEALSPVVTLLKTRNARGSYSRTAIRMLAGSMGGKYLHAGLHGNAGPLPLGWVLSDIAKQTMQQQLQAFLDGLPDLWAMPLPSATEQ